MLLDPFEEKLHLPPLFVKLGDGDGGQKKIVGQKHQGFVGLGIVISHPADFKTVSRMDWSHTTPVALSTGWE